MNRISRRSAAEAAETLLEVGRTQPVLHYDVELGLARHHHWLRSDAPMPEWASTSAGAAAKTLAAGAIKTIVSVVLVGALAVAAWHARGRLQPSAAGTTQSSNVTASESQLAPVPMPVSGHDLPTDAPARRTVRADLPDKRTTRSQRAHRELASVRGASARVEPTAPRAEAATPARVESPAAASAQPSDHVSVPQTTHSVVAAAPERMPVSAAHSAQPEPGPEAQVPDDLVEMQQVATAEQLLERSPERALALVRQGDQRFARGYFQQERAYVAIMALIRLGRFEEARARAANFAKRFPALPYGARIRTALEAREATKHETTGE